MTPSERALLLAVAEWIERHERWIYPRFAAPPNAATIHTLIAAVRAEAAKAENSGEWAR